MTHPSKKYAEWPKGPVYWRNNEILYISIPFTWNLPLIWHKLNQRSLFDHKVIIGGPAVDLMPNYFEKLNHVVIGKNKNTIQRHNPYATKTTIGCIRKCKFCIVPKIEPKFKELDAWPDLPILIDNNLLASSQIHFDKVIDRLIKWEFCDFNQGLDARLLKTYHAKRFKQIKKPMIRLALDNIKYQESWSIAFEKLMQARIAKTNIRSYALIGFDSGVDEAWERCNWIKSHGIKVLPMWFHELDALEYNQITEKQKKLGWNNFERKRIMSWFYKHRDVNENRIRTSISAICQKSLIQPDFGL